MTPAPFITVATATYNRAAYLPRVYASLASQTFTNFEWIIVDDGSTDNTQHVISVTTKAATFPIVLLRQENKGKHAAINSALREARGTLFFILDSDDWCTPDALEFMREKWVELAPVFPNLAGVTTLAADEFGNVVGKRFPCDGAVDHLLPFYQQNSIDGDKADIHSVEVLRRFPFPELPNVRFCPEALIWNRISSVHVTAFFNRITKRVQYLDSGLSANGCALLINYPAIYCIYYRELFFSSVTRGAKARACANLVRAGLHAGTFWSNLRALPLRYLFCTALGGALYVRDLVLSKRLTRFAYASQAS